ncbi:hypothetical protein HanIR_Chr14g0676641 [Helianthus annuus]|nr:hypothetical protein HanIR_Chr14g0676641 [Helianthus annuus]
MPCRPLGTYNWNLLSWRLEWSWVEMHGFVIQEIWFLHMVYKPSTNKLCLRCKL